MSNILKSHNPSIVNVTFEELFNHSVQKENPLFLYYSNQRSDGIISLSAKPVDIDDKDMMTYDEAFKEYKSLCTTLFTDQCVISEGNKEESDNNENRIIFDQYANLIARRTLRGRATALVDNKVLLYVGQNPADNAILVVKKGNKYGVVISPDVPDRVYPASHYGVMVVKDNSVA